MTEAIKTYPKIIENHMKTVANSLKYINLAQDLENSAGVVPPVIRYDEQGNKLTISADTVIRTIWKGAGEGAAREMQRSGYKQEVIDIANRNRR